MVLEGNKGCNFRHVEFEFILDTQGKVGRLKFRELSQLEIKSVGVLGTEMAISSLGGGRSGRQRECGEEV